MTAQPEAFARADTLLGPLALEVVQTAGARWRWQARRIGEPTVVVRSGMLCRSKPGAQLAALTWAERAASK